MRLPESESNAAQMPFSARPKMVAPAATISMILERPESAAWLGSSGRGACRSRLRLSLKREKRSRMHFLEKLLCTWRSSWRSSKRWARLVGRSVRSARGDWPQDVSGRPSTR